MGNPIIFFCAGLLFFFEDTGKEGRVVEAKGFKRLGLRQFLCTRIAHVIVQLILLSDHLLDLSFASDRIDFIHPLRLFAIEDCGVLMLLTSHSLNIDKILNHLLHLPSYFKGAANKRRRQLFAGLSVTPDAARAPGYNNAEVRDSVGGGVEVGGRRDGEMR